MRQGPWRSSPFLARLIPGRRVTRNKHERVVSCIYLSKSTCHVASHTTGLKIPPPGSKVIYSIFFLFFFFITNIFLLSLFSPMAVILATLPIHLDVSICPCGCLRGVASRHTSHTDQNTPFVIPRTASSASQCLGLFVQSPS